MGFSERFPLIPYHNTNPPPAWIQAVAKQIRLTEDYGGWVELNNQYLFQYSHSPTYGKGYLYCCLLNNENVEVFFSINEDPTPTIEVTRFSQGEIKVYVNNALKTTFPATSGIDTLVDGYILLYIPTATWLTGWTYRKYFRMVGSTDGDLTNFQITFTVNRTTGTDNGFTIYVGTKCKADFSDIRFVASDGETELSYCIKSISGNIATIVVKFPSIEDSPAILEGFIYYGNASATDESDGDETFVFFEDFLGDLSRWTSVPVGWVIDTARLKCNSNDKAWKAISDYDNYLLEFTINKPVDANFPKVGFYNSAKNAYVILMLNYGANQIEFYKTGWVSGGAAAQALVANTNYDVAIKKLHDSWYAYVGGVLKKTVASWYDFTICNIMLEDDAAVILYYSKIYLSKTTANLPTINYWGDEESV